MEEDKKNKRIRWATISHLFLALALVLLALALLVSYAMPRSSAFVNGLVEHSPFPLVVMGYTHTLSFRQLAQNMTSVKSFYENQDFSQVGLRVDFSTPEGKKRLKVREKEVLNKMIEDEAIMILAQARGITVTRDTARQGVARKLQEYGTSKEVVANLKRLYGWTLTDFEERVVVPSLYQEQLEQSFVKEVDGVSAAKKKIEQAQERLRQGDTFENVARDVSEGQTATTGGELGWFSLSDLAPELRKPVALEKVGVSGDVIESSLGFHIILVEEVKTEQGNQLYRLRQIFARKITFPDWLTEQMKTLPVWVLSSEYHLDRETTRVLFKDPALRTFEDELYKKSNGDALLLF